MGEIVMLNIAAIVKLELNLRSTIYNTRFYSGFMKYVNWSTNLTVTYRFLVETVGAVL